MYKIVFTGGGTAGHVVPNLSLIPYLQDEFEFSYIGSENGIEKKLVKGIMPYYSISTAKLQRSLKLSNFTIPFKVIKGYNDAKKVLSLIRPNIVFSKGGYVSVPVIYAAHKLNIPVITHESDLTKGLANRISAPKCNIVLTSFKETAKTFKNGKHVGPPLRKELFNLDKQTALKELNLSGNKPVLTVLGGSLGSKAINYALENILPEILPTFDVIHIVGKGNINNSLRLDGYKQIEYSNEIEKIFAVSDIVISRAGSNTLFELIALKIPSLIIPLPKGNSRGDQILNAEYFYKKGLIGLLYQKDLTNNSLINNIFSVYSNRYNLIRNMQKENVKDSSPIISDIIKQYALK